jgi:hypothetical protein
MGLFPTKIVELDKAKEKADKKGRPAGKAPKKKGKGANINIQIPGLSGKVKSKVMTAFTRQLATLVDAGLPLLRGLRVLEKQEKHSTLKQIVGELALSIEGGSTFSEALAQHPKVFNRLYVNMVKAGELGGVLEVVLSRLAEFMEKAQKIKGKVIAAMFYPVAVLVVSSVILGVLMTVVIPKFREVFVGLGDGRPLPQFTSIPSSGATYSTRSSSRCPWSALSSAKWRSPGSRARSGPWSAAAFPSSRPSPSSKKPPAMSSSVTPSAPSMTASRKAKQSLLRSRRPVYFLRWWSAWWTSVNKPAPCLRCS